MLALVLALVSSSPASPVVPEPPLWRAPAGCPSQAEVEALLAEEAEDSSEASGAAVVTAVASRTERERWRVQIVVRTAGAEVRRELELDSCEAAAEAVALVYGLALADAPTPTSAPSEAESPVPGSPAAGRPEIRSPSDPPTHARRETPPARSIPEASKAAPPASHRPKPVGVLHGGAGAGLGSLGRASAHVLLGTALVWPRLRWGVRLDHAFSRRFRIDPGDLGGNLSALTAGMEVSVPVELGPVQLLPTAGVRAGGIRARGVGGARSHTRWVPWVLGAAGVSVVWPTSTRWGLRAGAEVEVPMVQHTFVFDTRFVTASRRVGGLLWVGPELRFR
ncbi:MAG: hypothetical protein ACRBN8_29035 [Nannocystales bacterium]